MISWKWLAGFYEGEGSPSVWTGKRQPQRYFTVTIVQTEKKVLNAIRDFVGHGSVHPRRHRVKRTHRKQWAYRLGGVEAVKFAAKIRPHMNSYRKIRQLATVLKQTQY